MAPDYHNNFSAVNLISSMMEITNDPVRVTSHFDPRNALDTTMQLSGKSLVVAMCIGAFTAA